MHNIEEETEVDNKLSTKISKIYVNDVSGLLKPDDDDLIKTRKSK